MCPFSRQETKDRCWILHHRPSSPHKSQQVLLYVTHRVLVSNPDLSRTQNSTSSTLAPSTVLRSKMAPLEIPVFSPSSATIAVSQGAHRIELNRAGSYAAGGLTPEPSDLEGLEDVSVPLRIMIRPRGPPPVPEPDFVYSQAEFEEMKAAVISFKESGNLSADRGDGFVFGILKSEEGPSSSGSGVVVDGRRNAELVKLAQPFKCVFHRAFDDVLGSAFSGGDGMVASMKVERALEDILGCGFDGILTSGGPGRAPDNVGILEQLVDMATGHLEIIVGGGVRSQNLASLKESLPADSGVWFHSSCLTARSGEVVDAEEVKSVLKELEDQ